MSLNMLKVSVLSQGGILGFANPLPGSPNAGDVYVVTTTGGNQNNVAVYDNGAWVYFIPQPGWILYNRGTSQYIAYSGSSWSVFNSGNVPWDFQPPLSSQFTTISGDSNNITLVDDSNVGLLVNGGTLVSGPVGRFAYKVLTTPSSNWSLVVKANILMDPSHYSSIWPIMLQDPVGGHVTGFGPAWTGYIEVDWLSDINTFTSAPASSNSLDRPKWFRIDQVSSNLYFYISPDGKTWIQLYTCTTASLFANPPARIGFGIQCQRTTGYPLNYSIPYWQLSGPAV